MSIRELTRVWDHCDADPAEKLALLAIADFANDNGIAWPGRARLMQMTNTRSRTTMRKRIANLVARGDLYWMRREGRGTHYVILTGCSDIERARRRAALRGYMEDKYQDDDLHHAPGHTVDPVTRLTRSHGWSGPGHTVDQDPVTQGDHDPLVTTIQPPPGARARDDDKRSGPGGGSHASRSLAELHEQVFGFMPSPWLVSKMDDLVTDYGIVALERAMKTAATANKRKLNYVLGILRNDSTGGGPREAATPRYIPPLEG